MTLYVNGNFIAAAFKLPVSWDKMVYLTKRVN